jgi:hypothetical protein
LKEQLRKTFAEKQRLAAKCKELSKESRVTRLKELSTANKQISQEASRLSQLYKTIQQENISLHEE